MARIPSKIGSQTLDFLFLSKYPSPGLHCKCAFAPGHCAPGSCTLRLSVLPVLILGFRRQQKTVCIPTGWKWLTFEESLRYVPVSVYVWSFLFIGRWLAEKKEVWSFFVNKGEVYTKSAHRKPPPKVSLYELPYQRQELPFQNFSGRHLGNLSGFS